MHFEQESLSHTSQFCTEQDAQAVDEALYVRLGHREHEFPARILELSHSQIPASDIVWFSGHIRATQARVTGLNT